MVAGATSLNLVREELFSTIEEAELSLEQFIADRPNGSLLQQAVENLNQVRGTLNLVELTGAELLAQEMLQQANDIPAGAGAEHDAQLAALSNALYVLRRYLESVDNYRVEMPELLLPAINDLRQAGGQPPLPESFFFNVRLDPARPPLPKPAPVSEDLPRETRRLRHMYQIGLLGLLRDDNLSSSLNLMLRALKRLDHLYSAQPSGRLSWVAAAAVEAQIDGQLLPRKARKQLFARVDRELKQLTAPEHSSAKPLLKELLYLVALADSSGPYASQVREAFALSSLPFTDHLLEEQYQRLAGPGQAVMRSLSAAIREELASLKDMLDLMERGSVSGDSLSNLHTLLGKLSKTLGMVGLTSAGNALHGQLAHVLQWSDTRPPSGTELSQLADVVLYVEGMVASLVPDSRPKPPQPQDEAESFAAHQFNEARIVVLDEARSGLALAKRAITAYLESGGERMHLANVPFSLQAVRGGLWFLDQAQAASLVGSCAQYIQQHMFEAAQMPSQTQLETLADALSSLEYYLEGGAVKRTDRASVLDLAADSVRALGMPVEA
ncbi:ferrous iron transporter B [Pseudomonas sp. 5P_3.1_Bac2]|uniref:ferrous iron transporter B n=1 Tax=Pseudomonas sp. 5P_3.1_Bac2 TaxID=2971617 RepID=UPI0021CA7452|nr:ferrous iron transporter B [Pseudomonas sp. 5P_3.1_Bac2]MCU1717459.1 ferrous iron transporter B [Pseudomonas sp. 5P_3.1_Bac2]